MDVNGIGVVVVEVKTTLKPPDVSYFLGFKGFQKVLPSIQVSCCVWGCGLFEK